MIKRVLYGNVLVMNEIGELHCTEAVVQDEFYRCLAPSAGHFLLLQWSTQQEN